MEENEPSDIGTLWEEALDKYYASTKTNLKRVSQQCWTITALKEEQEREMQRFTHFLHDGKSVDKLRSMFIKYSDIILGVAQNVANAASAVRSPFSFPMTQPRPFTDNKTQSFPPSVAIMTAFTYVMKVCRNSICKIPIDERC
jgi:hypothetical protein